MVKLIYVIIVHDRHMIETGKTIYRIDSKLTNNKCIIIEDPNIEYYETSSKTNIKEIMKMMINKYIQRLYIGEKYFYGNIYDMIEDIKAINKNMLINYI